VTPDDIRDLFAAFGPVTVRRMFSGAGIYADGLMFGLVAAEVIYLKVDAHNTPAFEREDLPAFTYTAKGGKRAVMSYRRMPDRLYDDPDELAAWARDALAAARRSQQGGRPSARAGSRQSLKKPAKRAR
jgi:DNA transformation protein